MGTKGVQMKGVFLGWFVGLFVPVQEIFACSSWPSTKYFYSFVSIAQQAGHWADSRDGSPVS